MDVKLDTLTCRQRFMLVNSILFVPLPPLPPFRPSYRFVVPVRYCHDSYGALATRPVFGVANASVGDRQGNGLDSGVISKIFLAGMVSSMVTGLFAGSFLDRYLPAGIYSREVGRQILRFSCFSLQAYFSTAVCMISYKKCPSY